jgi:hypothetical protein
MRFDLTRPCASCPFRSDIHFGLRPARVREILGADSFACHKTVDYDEDGDGRVKNNSQHCAGVLWILHKENRPNQLMRIAGRLRLWDPASLDPTAPFYASAKAAIKGQHAHVRPR